MGARDPSLRVILEALGGSRDCQEARGTLQRAPEGSPDGRDVLHGSLSTYWRSLLHLALAVLRSPKQGRQHVIAGEGESEIGAGG